MTATMEQPQVDSYKQFDPATIVEGEPALDIQSLGEGLTLIGRKTVELDKEFSTKLLELAEFSGDRALRDEHVLRLKNAMDRGTFRADLVQIVTCALNGVEYRMNGQHTAWARLYASDPKYRCAVQHLRYKAASEFDLRNLYSSIDRAAPRTTSNVIISYLYETPEYDGYSKKVLARLAEGLAIWKWESVHERHRHDADDRAFLLKTDYLKLGQRVASFIDKCLSREQKHVFRAPCVAAMFATFDKVPTHAQEFWEPVRDGTGVGTITDPRLKLRNLLMSAAIAVGKGASQEKRSVSSEEMLRSCLTCWNAWRAGQQLQLVRPNMSTARPAVK